MNNDDGTGRPEIVIVRRRAVDDVAAGKGGAWKIAYADFVTAMMAFFLVMWLINASNEKTRSQVASYFNPIKLTDTSTGVRSLKDIKDTHNPQSAQTGGIAEGTPPSKKDVKEEAEMLANPPKSLDRISKTLSDSTFQNAGLDSTVEVAPSLKPDKNNPGVGDPFDPRSWDKAEPAGATKDRMKDDRSSEHILDSEASDQNLKPAETGSEAIELRQEIAKNLGNAEREVTTGIEVKATSDGLLVSLTESADFEMFKKGSAEPEPQMLKLVKAIAEALKSKPGTIVIRGHTDSRPYRNKYYDNWQLSTARANLARYMLIRGGLDSDRIRRIEGVADLEPRNAKDPQAPENRRIEIFIGGNAS